MKDPIITKIQRETGASYEQLAFLMEVFAGAANLYGIIRIDDLYGIYQDIERQNSDYPEISLEQFAKFSNNVDSVDNRLVVIDQRVFNKFITNSGQKLEFPLLVNKEIVEEEFKSKDIWHMYRDICEFSHKFYLTPPDLRDFADPEVSAEDRAFRNCLSKLKIDGLTLNKIGGLITDDRSGLQDIAARVTLMYQLSPGNLDAASSELHQIANFFEIDFGKYTFDQVDALMKKSLCDKPCWGLGGYTCVELLGINKDDIVVDDHGLDEEDDPLAFILDAERLPDYVKDEEDRKLVVKYLKRLKRSKAANSDGCYLLSDFVQMLNSSPADQEKTVSRVAYPKRLLDKTMKKRYGDAGFEGEKLDFLHQLFQAAVNLYGVITLQKLIEIYKKLQVKNNYPEVSDQEFAKFAELVRREQVPYYVFEQHELFRSRENADFARILVNEDVLGPAGHLLDGVYNIYWSEYVKEYWIPDDLLAFTSPQLAKEKQNLLAYLTKLGCPNGEKVSPESKRLAQKIVDYLVWSSNVMHDDFEPLVEKNFSQLLDNGKREVNDKIKKQLAQRIHNYESNRHAYMLKGWKDSDLQEHPELDGETIEKYRVMTLIADLINPDRAAD